MRRFYTVYEKRGEKHKKRLFEIARRRGLGFQQKEIAEILKISQGEVSYSLKELRELCRKEGIEATWDWMVED